MRRRENGNPGTEDSVPARTSECRSRGYAVIQGLAVWDGSAQDFTSGSTMAGLQASGPVRSDLIRPNPTEKKNFVGDLDGRAVAKRPTIKVN